MQHVCRSCKQMAEIPEYRTRKGDWTCQPCVRLRDAAWRRARGIEVRGSISRCASDAERLERARASERKKYCKRRANPADLLRMKARGKTRSAIARGKLIRQPCEVCGTAKVEAHHDDYSKPFDVRWLCQKHHHDHHRETTNG